MAVRALIELEGETGAMTRLKLSRSSVVRLAGRLTCRRGTVVAAALALGITL
jgi:hypothetical protein